jgi:hypothetical protein
MRFNDECDWEWEDWVEPFTKAVLKHAGIKTTEIYGEMMDADYIHICVTEWDTASGEYVEVKYLLYYMDAVESLHRNLLFFYILYRPEGDYSTVRDYGAYQIVRDDDTGRCFAYNI